MVFKIQSSPLGWPFSAKPTSSLLDACLRQRATVTEVIRPDERGRVAFQATTWFAVCPYQVVILPGAPVCVVGQYNATTLIVEPVQRVNAQPMVSDQTV
ncbi:MAG: NfeD family protein [Elainellaceae cyanobacterium]